MIDNQAFEPVSRKLIAPLWHTGLMLLVILALVLLGAYAQGQSSLPVPSGQPVGKATFYLSLIALQYGLFRLIRIGLRRSGLSTGNIIGRADNSTRALGYDLSPPPGRTDPCLVAERGCPLA
jgi:hypothetical protein